MSGQPVVATAPPAISAGAVRAVLVRPGLWRTGVVQLLRLASPGWWRRWPPVPRPDAAWLAFRLETQYGSASAEPSAEDVVAWLRWCRDGRSHPSGVHRRPRGVR